MPWSIYSSEDFPKMQRDGYWADYRGANGMTIILKGHQWNDLDELGYKKDYYNSWVEAAGDAKEIFVSSKQVAERIVRDAVGMFGQRLMPLGMAFCNTDKTSEKEMKELAKAAETQNLAYRKCVVEEFEIQFRGKVQGGPGRYIPTLYEEECYNLLEMRLPEVIQKPQVPQQIIVQPNEAMIAELVTAEVNKRMAELTAPAGKGK